MPLYSFADLVFDLEPRYPLTLQRCTAYRTEAAKADVVIRITEQQINDCLARDASFSPAYYEGLCIYRAICTHAAERGAVLLHAATVSVDGKAYAFCAPSGTGKSTHIKLWRRVYGEKVAIINGDKPLLRRKGDQLYAYGTPWCGKEGWHCNTSAPLAGICFLERGTQNDIIRLNAEEATDRLFCQLLKPTPKAGVAGTLDMADYILRNIPLYLLHCDISEQAARLSYQTMTGQH